MKTIARRTTATTFAALFAIGLTAVPAGAASEWDLDFTAEGTETISAFGFPNTATYGQTFTVPEGPVTLESFSVDVIDLPTGVVFRGAVQAWDADARVATGEVLYLSEPVSTATGTGRETMTFTPDIDIAPGTYVLYTTLSYDYEGQTDAAGRWAASAADPYADGMFVFMNNSGDEAALTAGPWSDLGTAYDAAFTVVYADAVVPPVVPPVTPPPATPVIVAPAYTG